MSRCILQIRMQILVRRPSLRLFEDFLMDPLHHLKIFTLHGSKQIHSTEPTHQAYIMGITISPNLLNYVARSTPIRMTACNLGILDGLLPTTETRGRLCHEKTRLSRSLSARKSVETTSVPNITLKKIGASSVKMNSRM